MRPMLMTARILFFALIALTSALLLAVACGGDGDGERPTGRLTDPRSVSTATPWANAPEPIILEPGALTPIIQEGDEQGEEISDEEIAEVTPVTPYQITVEESANRRTSPSTGSAIAGIMTAGQERTVTGQVQGEAVEEGNDIWYQLDDGSFVFSGAVKKVQE
jgi:hypothetical protein